MLINTIQIFAAEVKPRIPVRRYASGIRRLRPLTLIVRSVEHDFYAVQPQRHQPTFSAGPEAVTTSNPIHHDKNLPRLAYRKLPTTELRHEYQSPFVPPSHLRLGSLPEGIGPGKVVRRLGDLRHLQFGVFSCMMALVGACKVPCTRELHTNMELRHPQRPVRGQGCRFGGFPHFGDA